VATFSPEEWEAYERAKMAEQDARGALAVARLEGVEAGELKGQVRALLALLAARGISVSDEARAHIETCDDAATLGRWIVLAATATFAEAVISAGSRPTAL
jgi:hypothetical protein